MRLGTCDESGFSTPAVRACWGSSQKLHTQQSPRQTTYVYDLSTTLLVLYMYAIAGREAMTE